MSHSHEPILIVGGGGHALVVAEAARLAGYAVAGFLDDAPGARLSRRLVRLGGLSRLDDPDLLQSYALILAVGELSLRRRLLERLDARARFQSVIHPSAAISPTATIAFGVFIGPAAVIHTDARIDAHAILNTAAVVEHDSVIGVNTHLAPRVVLGGDVQVGADTLIGLGAAVLPGVQIGDGCTIGAGAVVLHNLEHNCTVAGVPARRLH